MILTMSARETSAKRWLERTLDGPFSVSGMRGDASARKYFLVRCGRASRVLMDAPPETEPIDSFLSVAERLRAAQVHVPTIYAFDRARGFVLMEFLEGDLLLDCLRRADASADALYADAMRELAKVRRCGCDGLPDFSADMLTEEMELFVEWYCARHLNVAPTRTERRVLDDAFRRLVDNALGQPQVCVHRDYHSRNLVVCEGRGVGVLDFQDAVRGPVSYDIASLLGDCYIAWPLERVRRWARDFFRACADESGVEYEEARCEEWFDLTALQRHIKVAGTFARLAYRDGKRGFLDDLPLTMRYVTEEAARHPSMAPLLGFVRGLPPP